MVGVMGLTAWDEDLGDGVGVIGWTVWDEGLG